VPPVPFDRFLTYDELTGLLQGWHDERPDIFRVESIGRSWEGREIWLATVTSAASGPAAEKPAFLIEANIHSVEWTGSAAALHLLRRLVDGYGADERVTRLLDTRAFYVVPRLNPDGAEHALVEGRPIRSSVRPWPLEEQPDGLRVRDVDGDRRVLQMRVRDDNGAWTTHRDEPRLMVPREADEAGGEYYRLFPEGEIHNYDGVTVKMAPPLEGLDLNRNFPYGWETESIQRGAGPYPVSEPEIRAYVQAVIDRPNITGHISYHTFSGVHLRPYASDPDEHFPTEDLRTFLDIGAKATSLTGYPAVSIFHGFKYDPKQPIRGDVHDWLYEQLGLITWTTEFWSPQREAGLDVHPIEWLQGHPPEDDLALIRWADEHYPGRAYVDWYAFEHPQLGPVELGGWDRIGHWANVPFDRLEEHVAPHTEWAIWSALISPLLEIRSFEAEPVGGEAWRVRLVLENSGWLPTSVTRKAVERKAVRPVEVELELPEGGSLAAGEPKVEAGQLEGRHRQRSTYWWGTDWSTGDVAKLEWVVLAPSGGDLRVVARHQRAGTARAAVQLGPPR
jgi:murein tripeptide amidase MpaA